MQAVVADIKAIFNFDSPAPNAPVSEQAKGERQAAAETSRAN